MPRLSAAVACALLVTVGVSAHLGASRPQRAPNLSSKALAALATKYVAAYRQQFVFLVADEDYVQVVSDGAGVELQRRTLRGELFLTYLDVDREWVAVHDFATVGGNPVPDRDDIRALLQRGATGRIMRLVATRNARLNIGSVERDFNEPTLALLVLEAQRIGNFDIDRKQVVQDGDTALAMLEFVERSRPTIVSSKTRGHVFSRGEITIEAATGRIRHTRIEFRADPVVADLTTTYAFDSKLDLWVPSVFRERYEAKQGKRREVITCEATYTNYRRFEGIGRIK